MTDFKSLSQTAGRTLKHFCADEGGATAIEYALMASGIGVAVAATVWTLGSGVKNLFTSLSDKFP